MRIRMKSLFFFFFTLNFWWEDLLWKEQSGLGRGFKTSSQAKTPGQLFSLENATCPFPLILRWNLYQTEITIRCSFASKPTTTGLLLQGRDKLRKDDTATKVCPCSVFKAPDPIRFLIRNKCPHQCSIKRSSHTEWIQNVKAISIERSTSRLAQSRNSPDKAPISRFEDMHRTDLSNTKHISLKHLEEQINVLLGGNRWQLAFWSPEVSTSPLLDSRQPESIISSTMSLTCPSYHEWSSLKRQYKTKHGKPWEAWFSLVLNPIAL